jgi:adenine-specific DNA-methyltransferase
LRLDYRAHGAPISALQPLLGQSGWLDVSELHVQSVGASEFLMLVGRTDNGDTLDDDLCQKLLSLPATVDGPLGSELSEDVDLSRLRRADELRTEVASRNTAYFDEETAKLDRWADDLKSSLEQDLRDIERQIREARRAAVGAVTLAEKLEAQKQVRDLEGRRSTKRRELYEDQDRVEQQRDVLINDIEKQLEQQSSIEALFTIRWTLVG